jgi:uncharacterized membrane protein YcaP (DUF421 family)
MFYDNAFGLLRIVIVEPLIYVSLVAVLRIAGKRTLGQLNAFDYVITVALGSTLATAVLSKDVAFWEGVLGFVMLAGLQFAIAWTALRWRLVERIVKARPSVLLLDGAFDEDAMRRERVTADEIRAAIRKHGIGDLAQVAAVVLETDGRFSVVPLAQAGKRTAFP